MAKTDIRFGGFGGQGIITASYIIGIAGVMHEGKDALQTQSFGTQARGGQCRAEVMISDIPLSYAPMTSSDALVVMSQPALDSYLKSLKPGGLLIVDSSIVKDIPERDDIEIIRIPASEMATKMGNKVIANMILVGALVEKMGLIKRESLTKAIEDTVPSRFVELNIQAIEEGKKLVQAS